MALKLSTETSGKIDVLKFDPRVLPANFPAFTGRVDRTEVAIQDMVESLLTNGQINPFSFRKGFNQEAITISGFTRILAAIRITEQGLTSTFGGVSVTYGPDQPFLLEGKYKAVNATEAMFLTMAENDSKTRTPIKPVDLALFIRTIGETTDMNDAAIAKRLNINPSEVSKLRIVLLLDDETREMLNQGEIKFDTAVNVVAKIDPTQRPAVFAAARADGGKMTAANIARIARNMGVATAKPLTNGPAAVNAFWKEIMDDEAMPEGPVRDFAFKMRDFQNGQMSAAELKAAFVALAAVTV